MLHDGPVTIRLLTYPESALVPEARRELDRVRNLVPRS